MNRQKQYLGQINAALEQSLSGCGERNRELSEAMRYSLLAGGKRVRPVLLLKFCRLCGGEPETALPFACAVEMVHAYSLIHDDLPCMDNDDLRRGKPSNHKVFGEAMALLAGDALLTLAFETALSPRSIRLAGAEKAALAAGELARAAGARGMVGGQAVDLASQGKRISLAELRKMDEGKTGALILAAGRMGCILGGGSEKMTKAAEKYAEAVGLAFQIVDDILDVTGDSAVLGKKTGADSLNGKCTYVSLMGLEQASAEVEKLTEEAVRALSQFDGDTEYLCSLAKELAARKK